MWHELCLMHCLSENFYILSGYRHNFLGLSFCIGAARLFRINGNIVVI
jgi:hypothetical protein